jgi:nitronate monooxygenase
VPTGPVRAPFGHDAADVLASFKPPIVSFHFGLSSKEFLDRVRE